MRPAFQYDSAWITHDQGAGESISSVSCVNMLGYQVFDFRRLDKHMRDAPRAGSFGAEGSLETILCGLTKSFRIDRDGNGCKGDGSGCTMLTTADDDGKKKC